MTGSAKQSRAAYDALDCFVAALLAMTTMVDAFSQGLKDAKVGGLCRDKPYAASATTRLRPSCLAR
jgi:hypothetical protein